MPESNEPELLREAKAGSNYAMAMLLEQNYGIVYKFILKLTLNTQLASDVTQDCMVRAIDKFILYDPEKSAFSTWLVAIAKNLCIEEYRKAGRREKYLQQSEYESLHDPADEIIEKDELLSALKKLSAKLRIPLILSHGSGYTYDEIAGMLKIPVGTVKSRISNALKQLKKEMKADEK